MLINFHMKSVVGKSNLPSCHVIRYTMNRKELCRIDCTHRVISDKVHRLLVTLSYFRPDRFVQLFGLLPSLILLLFLLVSIVLVYTGLCELVTLVKATVFQV